MSRDDPREVSRALAYMDAEDRDTWIHMAFAVRDALGEDGRAIWMRWSATSPKYDERVRLPRRGPESNRGRSPRPACLASQNRPATDATA